MKKHQSDLDKMGLIIRKGRMYWAVEGGHLAWLPGPAKHFICAVWSKLSCWKLGHDEYTYPKDSPYPDQTWCVCCNRRLK